MSRRLSTGAGACAVVILGLPLSPFARAEAPDALALTLDDDLRLFHPPAESDTEAAPLAVGEPRVVWLVYADGGPVPSNEICAGKTPPAFKCSYGGVEGALGCKKKVQAYLDRWYADFNVIFTFDKPTTPGFYTEIVTSDGKWCGQAAGGLASFICKRDLHDPMAVAYTFICGSIRPELCAAIISQEHAHLVGLDHTEGEGDVMYQGDNGVGKYVGFEDKDNAVQGYSACRKTQNSYQEMKAMLGAWPDGVAKPGPFGTACDDKLTPQIAITEPADQSSVPSSVRVRAEASDDCGLQEVSIEAAGASHTTKPPGPFEWTLDSLAGDVTITVTANDAAGHTAATSITVHAPGAAAPDGADPADDAGAGGGGDGLDAGKSGCGCTFTGAGTAPVKVATLTALAIAGAHGRRRRLATRPALSA